MNPSSKNNHQNLSTENSIVDVLNDELKEEYFYRWPYMLAVVFRSFSSDIEPLVETILNVAKQEGYSHVPSPARLMNWYRRWRKDRCDLRIQILEDEIQKENNQQEYIALLSTIRERNVFGSSDDGTGQDNEA